MTLNKPTHLYTNENKRKGFHTHQVMWIYYTHVTECEDVTHY